MSNKFAKPSAAALAAPGAIFACLLWGSAFPMIKTGLEYVKPLTFAGWRFILAGAILLPLCGRPSRYFKAVRTHWRLIVVVSMIQTVLLYTLFFIGMEWVQGAHAAIICGSAPLVTGLLAHWLMPNERLTPIKFCAIALGLAGVVLLAAAQKPIETSGLRQLAGMGLLVTSVVCASGANILVARYGRTVNPMVLNSVQIGLGGLVLTVIALVAEKQPTELPPLEFFGAMAWLAVISAACFSIWFALLKHVKVSKLEMWKFLLPVFGAALSWMILPEESPTWSSLVGVACVATAVAVSQMLGRNQHAEPGTGRTPSV